MAEQETQFDPNDVTVMEGPGTELARIISEGDPDLQLALLEKKAALGPRFAQAVNTILLTQTYPDDWQEFDGQMCLSSAGAERVGRLFDIKCFETKVKKEEYTDTIGKAYRYIFEGKVAMQNRVTFAQGVYSTRDAFLGKKSGEFRAVEDINEGNVRNAAYHIYIGNGIKSLLGIRGIPTAELNKIMSKAGADPARAGKVTHGQGTQGGTSADDTKLQQELGKILMDMANASQQIAVDDKGQYSVDVVSEAADPMDIAKASCKALTSFYSKKDKKMVDGLDSIKILKGKRLEIAVENARTLAKVAGAGWEENL